MPAHPSRPVYANFPSEKLAIGAGVAIFHIATERVVLCYHTRDRYWFLPKGRRNANEDTVRAAEREGFEETGYRNRALPLPLKHRQPDSEAGHELFVIEPLWTQLLPLTTTSQYLLFWYAAETVPREVEESYNDTTHEAEPARRVYRPPIPFPQKMSLQQRIARDSETGDDGKLTVYNPVRHEGTGVDQEELLYQSFLLPISEARQKLKGSVMEDVVKRGWDAILLRMKMEREQSDHPMRAQTA
ncbi:hypothetical protein M433DRAFT_74939 [Acidomyces richmondensis BFW]|nr:MAG: hypothetical protein FE78DRAFT_138635 [Acidomyces sp. 'richmondensis']KYG41889.1 hypothetical protein M433DRAFT_74939 [Acidomyces richmondensis BFW]